MKHIIVLGGGFAGVAAIKELIHKPGIKITLITQEPYHVFHASLYEVATSEMPQKSIAIPYTEIFGSQISVIKKQVRVIKPKANQVTLEDGSQLYYDYLLFALGSVPSYMHVPGLDIYGYPLKTLHDAVQIKQKVKELFAKHTLGHPVRIVIGGGGFSGVELSMELVHFARKLSKSNHSNPFTVTIIQGSDRLLKELSHETSLAAAKRAKKFLIGVYTKEHIKKVTREHILTDTEKLHEFDLLIWTGGVEANPLGEKSGLSINNKKQILTSSTLQSVDYENIFVAGDMAGTPEAVPWTATTAIAEGKCAGRNMLRLVHGIQLLDFEHEAYRYIVPMHGKFAVAEFPSFRLIGFSGWLLQQLVFLYYLLSILPLSKALKRWSVDEKTLFT